MFSMWKSEYPATLIVFVAVVLTGALVEASDYPVHVKFKDYDDGDKNDDAVSYFEDIARETGGGGIAIGVLLSVLCFPLFFVCWCGCCRRCTNTVTCKDKESRPGPKEKRWNLIVLGVCIICTCILAVLLGVFAGKSTDDVVDGIDRTVDSVDDAARFLCGGELQMRFFASDNDLSFDAIRDDIVATKGLAFLCDVNSVAAFLLSVNVSIDMALDNVKEAIDPGLNPLLHSVGVLRDAFVQTGNNVTELITISEYTVGNTTLLVNQINALNSNGYNIDTSKIPTTDLTDLSAGKSEVTKATNDVNQIYDETRQAIVVDLQGTTVDTINRDTGKVTREVDELFDSLIEKLQDLRDARKDIVNTGDDVESARSVVMGVTGAIVAMFVPFLLLGTLGAALRKESQTSCCSPVLLVRVSAVCIWSFVLLLVIIAGLASFVHIYVDDVCGVLLEGNAASNGLGLIAVNIDDQRFTVGDTTVDLRQHVEPMLTCPAGCGYANITQADLANGTIGTSVGCDNTTSFGLMLGVEEEFNFVTEIQEAVDDIKENINHLDTTSEVQTARAALSDALGFLNLNLDGAYDSLYYRGLINGVLADPSASQPAKDAATSTLAILDDIDTSLQNAVISQALTLAATAGIDTGLDMFQTATDDAITLFVNLADQLVALTARIVQGSRGALRCDWLGRAYSNVIGNYLCSDVNDGFHAVVILASLGTAVVYISLFVLLHAGRATSSADTIYDQSYPSGPVEMANPAPKAAYPEGTAF